MKKFLKIGILALLVLAVLTPFVALGADIKVKTSGPSGQGELIYWCPETGITNLYMGTNGVKGFTLAPGVSLVLVGNITGATNITASGVIRALRFNISGTNGTSQVFSNLVDEAGTIRTNINVFYDGIFYTNYLKSL